MSCTPSMSPAYVLMNDPHTVRERSMPIKATLAEPSATGNWLNIRKNIPE
ncbi:MAG: hypothetical protein U5L00_04900 [Desulfovermiculus sp.]|nr:hypothetical protein [Desulfovermiculus sp.]